MPPDEPDRTPPNRELGAHVHSESGEGWRSGGVEVSLNGTRVLLALAGVIAVVGALLIGEPLGLAAAVLLVVSAFLRSWKFAVLALLATAALAVDVIYEYHVGRHGLGSGLGGMAVGAALAVLALLNLALANRRPQQFP